MYVIVLDFGFPKAAPASGKSLARSSIDELACCTIRNFGPKTDQLVILAQTKTYQALAQRHVYLPGQLALIPIGQATTNGTTGGGTYHVLACAKDIIEQYEFGKVAKLPYGESYQAPTIYVVAHQLHLPRAIKQGKIFSMDLIPAAHLPNQFYPTAAQWWCRNKILWHLREAIGLPFLKWKHQI